MNYCWYPNYNGLHFSIQCDVHFLSSTHFLHYHFRVSRQRFHRFYCQPCHTCDSVWCNACSRTHLICCNVCEYHAIRTTCNRSMQILCFLSAQCICVLGDIDKFWLSNGLDVRSAKTESMQIECSRATIDFEWINSGTYLSECVQWVIRRFPRSVSVRMEKT